MSSKHDQNEAQNETQDETQVGVIVAGEIHAACACCDRPRWLVPHPALEAAQRVCPRSGKTYLDRGDGLFAPDGKRLKPATLQRTELAATAAEQATTAGEPDVLSDRPSRSGPQGSAKSRIALERATFAGPRLRR